MEKSASYYKKKTDFYYNLGKDIVILKHYAYLQERHYYNAISDSIEYKSIKRLYEDIFAYLIKYMHILEQKSVEEIFAYVLVLIELKYLCYTRNLVYSNVTLSINEIPILSALALNNHGKCRNLASLLSDFYSSEGYDAMIYGGIKQDLEEYMARKRTRIHADHAITIVSDAEYSYILDPAKQELYSLLEDEMLVSNKFSIMTKDRSRLASIQEKIYFTLPPLKEIKNIEECSKNIHKNILKLTNNLDIFDELYQEIRPALEEAESVYQKILRV